MARVSAVTWKGSASQHQSPSKKTLFGSSLFSRWHTVVRCTAYETVIFCWVMDRQDILDDVLAGLDASGCRVVPVSLTASAVDALTEQRFLAEDGVVRLTLPPWDAVLLI